MNKKETHKIKEANELTKKAIEKYIEFIPKTIGFLVNRYGPVTTKFFERGLISISKTSDGPPSPILNKSMCDQMANINPKPNEFIFVQMYCLVLVVTSKISVLL